jgi:integrase
MLQAGRYVRASQSETSIVNESQKIQEWGAAGTPFHGNTNAPATIELNGIQVDSDLLMRLLAQHLMAQKVALHPTVPEPTMQDAFDIYMHEKLAIKRKRFASNAERNFRYFLEQFGNIPLSQLRHSHATRFRDAQLARGLNPTSVRKMFATLNAMLNLAFVHLDLDRLNPLRCLHIPGEGDFKRPMRTITPELLLEVKERLLQRRTPYKLVALVQLNTGMRLSEPVFARRADLVTKHDIPHIWVRRNALSDRKTKSSIRAIPLVGASLDAALELEWIAKRHGSEWLVPAYARDNGNTSCSAIINKYLGDFQFRSHMFRHALIDRMKAQNDIPTRLAESITGHSSKGSDFDIYGTIGYTLEQKLKVLEKVAV